MNELIKVNIDTQTVSARDICKILDQYSDFTQFFIACSEMKLRFDSEEFLSKHLGIIISSTESRPLLI